MSSTVKFFVPPVMQQNIYPASQFGTSGFRLNVFDKHCFDVEVVRLSEFVEHKNLVLTPEQEQKTKEGHDLKEHLQFGSYFLAETTMRSVRAKNFVAFLAGVGIPAWTDSVANNIYDQAEAQHLYVDNHYMIELVDFDPELLLFCDVFPRINTVQHRSFKTNPSMCHSIEHKPVVQWDLKWFITEEAERNQ